MISRGVIALLAALGSGGSSLAAADSCALGADDLLTAMAEAHGGMDAWRRLQALRVGREHHFAGREEPIRFTIHAEYDTGRMLQQWQQPTGTVVWDGERAWSVDWDLHDTFLPRFVMNIGFPLVNLPWLAQGAADSAEALGCQAGLPADAQREFPVVGIRYEPPTARKPDWFEGPRNRYELWIDPDSFLLAGVVQHWTYAGQLDLAGAPPAMTEIVQWVVMESTVNVEGLVFWSEYSAYRPDGAPAASGRFWPYELNVPIDPTAWQTGSASIRPDTSSSYLRVPHAAD